MSYQWRINQVIDNNTIIQPNSHFNQCVCLNVYKLIYGISINYSSSISTTYMLIFYSVCSKKISTTPVV